jgi:single-strand DNA-binding protein
MEAQSMNKVQLEGRLGKDPEVRFLPAGGQLTVATLATNNSYKGKDGSWIEKPSSWHNLTAFGGPALALAEFRKGDIVKVEGKIQYDEWQDKDGKKRTSTKILCFLVEKSGATKQ